ncbi:hypothetical protein ACS0TY_003329 [Phlomoides rotata]
MIRIIHIVAPKIIKTEVENFRGLVQSLTGKPLDKTSTGNMMMKKKGKKISSMQKKENPNTFLSFLGDVEGFMHGMSEYPQPLPFRSSQFGDHMPLC